MSILTILDNQGGTVDFSAPDFRQGRFFVLQRGETMKQYIVDAFADRVFEGNAAAVCILDCWPEDDLMLKIARENSVPETAFVVKEEAGYHLRWFSSKWEVDLCGYATLAAAYVIFAFVEDELAQVTFRTKSGPLTVKKRDDLLEMDFPAYTLTKLEVTDQIADALGARPKEVWRARDLLCVFENPEDVVNMKPDLEKLKQVKGALMQVTAPGTGEYDCISRTFGPKCGMTEDPVCGSGHCHIIPYWAARTGKTEFVARQASPRGGTLYCRLEGDRVLLAGRAALFAESELMVEELL